MIYAHWSPCMILLPQSTTSTWFEWDKNHKIQKLAGEAKAWSYVHICTFMCLLG